MRITTKIRFSRRSELLLSRDKTNSYVYNALVSKIRKAKHNKLANEFIVLLKEVSLPPLAYKHPGNHAYFATKFKIH